MYIVILFNTLQLATKYYERNVEGVTIRDVNCGVHTCFFIFVFGVAWLIIAETGKDGDWKGQISVFKDYFNSWSECFELYVLLNEINVHKKKLMFLTLLGNEGYLLLRDLCSPNKSLDRSYDVLKELLVH